MYSTNGGGVCLYRMQCGDDDDGRQTEWMEIIVQAFMLKRTNRFNGAASVPVHTELAHIFNS